MTNSLIFTFESQNLWLEFPAPPRSMLNEPENQDELFGAIFAHEVHG